MEQTKKLSGLSANGVKIWGYLFLALGILSRSILQNGLLGLQETSMEDLLHAMQSSQTVMLYVTLALVFKACSTCAVPIFAFLLVEGAVHTNDLLKYCLRICGLAVVCELPYNLAASGKLMDLSSRNPVFAMALAMIVLLFYAKYGEKKAAHIGVKAVVTLAAFAWSFALRIEDGAAILLMVCALWGFRKERLYQNFVGACAAALCGIFSPFFFAAPMGVMVLHFYNGEKGEGNRKVQYLVYPVMLVLGGVVSLLL